MKFQIIGSMHEDVTFRERVSFTESRKIQFYEILKIHRVQQAIILSTCNRSQIILISNLHVDELVSLYCNFFDVPHDNIAYYENQSAYELLLQIACGVNSVVFGEDEIFHQLKMAYLHAQNANMVKKELHKIIQKCFYYVKKIRNQYALNQFPKSSTYLAYCILKKNKQLNCKNILLCGNGSVIQSFLPYLYKTNCNLKLLVRKKKDEIRKNDSQISYSSFSKKWESWNWADVIISATSAPHYIFPYVNHDDSNIAQKFILDMAIPKDIDPEWAKFHVLYDIDEVQAQLNTYDAHTRKQKENICLEIQSYAKQLKDLSYNKFDTKKFIL